MNASEYQRKMTEIEVNEEFNDKIYLEHLYKYHNIPGPSIIYSSNTLTDISHIIKDISNYCVKPSHLSESQCVIIVKNGILHKTVKTNLIENVKIPKKYQKYTAGYKITSAEVQDFVLFFMTVSPTWENKSRQNVKPGVVVEKLVTGSEIKIFIGLGNVLGHYGWGVEKDNYNIYILHMNWHVMSL